MFLYSVRDEICHVTARLEMAKTDQKRILPTIGFYLSMQFGVQTRSMNETRQVAIQNINVLFELAKQNISSEPELAQRYTEIARRIAMRMKLRLPLRYRRMICRHCKRFIHPGVNSRVRLQQKRESHIVVTCLSCGKHGRILLKPRKPERREKKK